LIFEALEDRLVLDGSFGSWGTPVNLGPVVNSAANDQHPALSPDGLSLYITSNRPGSVLGPDGKPSLDLWVSQRATRDGDWGTPVSLGDVINGPGRDFSPVFSPDGHWMIYARAPGGDENGDDLYITHRADKHDDFGWGTPVNLGPNINVPGYGDSGPALFEDPTTGLLNLYFTSNRPGGKGDWDIYRSVRQEDGAFSPAELVPEVSSPYRDVRITIRGDGLEMILTAANPAYLPAPNPQAALDLYVSTRPTTQSPWSTPVNLNDLGSPVNSTIRTVADSAPYLSRDGKTLFFYSNRPGSTLGPDGMTPSNDLYMCTRKELDEGEEAADVPADVLALGRIEVAQSAGPSSQPGAAAGARPGDPLLPSREVARLLSAARLGAPSAQTVTVAAVPPGKRGLPAPEGSGPLPVVEGTGRTPAAIETQLPRRSPAALDGLFAAIGDGVLPDALGDILDSARVG
jgi:hypothetical protein